MAFYNITDTFTEEVKKYQADADYLTSLVKKGQWDQWKKILGDDGRDFTAMILAMGIEGETEEERKRYMEQKVTEIGEAFASEDRSRRDVYLDAMYDFMDNFDPEAVDMNDPEQVRKLFCFAGLQQAYETKKKHNEEYYNKRYDTPQKLAVSKAKVVYMDAVAGLVLSDVQGLGLRFDSGVSLAGNLNGFFGAATAPFQKAAAVYARNSWLKEKQALETGVEASKSYDAVFPDVLNGHFKLGVKQLPNLSERDEARAEYFQSLCIENLFIRSDVEEFKDIVKEGVFLFQLIHIDGKSINDFLKEQFPDHKGSFTNSQKAAVQTLALMSGEHRVEVVTGMKDADGNMQYGVVPVKPVFSEAQQKAYKAANYSWFRRTFFDWGPFRIKTIQEKADDLYANDPDRESRHAQITTDVEDLRKTRQTERENEAIKERIIKEKAARIDLARENAKEQLHKDAQRFDKGSPMSILGDRVKNVFAELNAKFRVKESERYAAVAEPIARLVLFQLILQERENAQIKGLEVPGKLETKLLGDGTEASINKRIDKSVQQFVKDKAFKDLITEKAEVTYSSGKELSRDTFDENVLCNGGLRKFANEYMKKHNEEVKEQESNEIVNENNLDRSSFFGEERKEETINLM